MPNDGNDVPTADKQTQDAFDPIFAPPGGPEVNWKIWLYGGIGAVVVVVGVAIFFFSNQTKPPQAAAPTVTTTATSVPPITTPLAFPVTIPIAPPSSSITIGIQNISGPLVVQWKNLPSGTSKINVFRSSTKNGPGVLIGSVNVPPSSSGGGSGSLNIPSTDQGGYYYGSTSGGGSGGSGGSGSGSGGGNGGGGSGGTPSYNSPAAPPTDISSSTPTSSDSGSGGSGGSGSSNGTSTSGGGDQGSSNPSSSPSSSDSSYSPGSPSSSPSSSPPDSGNGTSTPSSTTPGGDQGSGPPVSEPPDQGSCDPGYVLIGNSCMLESALPTQASLTWNGSDYSVENGLYTDQDVVYISDVTNESVSNVTVYCSYTHYSTALANLGYGNYEISGLSSHECNIPNSIDYLNIGGRYGDALNISINYPTSQ